jgi:hypothetical protein
MMRLAGGIYSAVDTQCAEADRPSRESELNPWKEELPSAPPEPDPRSGNPPPRRDPSADRWPPMKQAIISIIHVIQGGNE